MEALPDRQCLDSYKGGAMKPLLFDILRDKKLYLLDMDGTLYLGDRLCPATPPLLDARRAAGAR